MIINWFSPHASNSLYHAWDNEHRDELNTQCNTDLWLHRPHGWLHACALHKRQIPSKTRAALDHQSSSVQLSQNNKFNLNWLDESTQHRLWWSRDSCFGYHRGRQHYEWSILADTWKGQRIYDCFMIVILFSCLCWSQSPKLILVKQQIWIKNSLWRVNVVWSESELQNKIIFQY